MIYLKMNKTNHTEPIEIYIDSSIHFDVPGFSRRVFNFFLVPILNNLPHKLLSFVVKSHRSAKEVVANKTQHTALEILYQQGSTFSSRNFFEKMALWIWFGLDNPRAVRNRLKIVKKEIQKELSNQFENKEEVFLLSIASGSARAVLEAIANTVEKYPQRTIDVVFLDKNPMATEYSKNLATELNLFPHKDIHISWVTDTVGTYLTNMSSPNSFDIIEMVGLLDYFADEKALSTFTGVLALLKSQGIFVCANIDTNRERKFVTRFIGWKMIYRSAQELVNLLVKSGFNRQSITVFYEPLRIHSITSARNTVS